jgi:hypothetical protein
LLARLDCDIEGMITRLVFEFPNNIYAMVALNWARIKVYGRGWQQQTQSDDNTLIDPLGPVSYKPILVLIINLIGWNFENGIWNHMAEWIVTL